MTSSVDDRDPAPPTSPIRRPDDLRLDDGPEPMVLELDRASRTAERRRHRRGRRVRLAIYAVALLSLTVAIPLLARIGARAVLDSRDGEIADPVLDPSEPGYQAVVPPTPTLLVAHVGPDGVAGLTLLVVAGGDRPGGSVLFIPPAVEVDLDGIGTLTIADAAALAEIDSALGATEQLLNLSIDDLAILDAEGWRRAVDPVGSLTIENPDALTSPDGTTVFPPGPLTLAPDQVGPYLAAAEPGEDPGNPLLRQELVWRAWLDAVAAAGPSGAPPGEVDSGLGRFVPAVASGSRRVETLPASVVEVPAPGVADPDAGEPAAGDPGAADPGAVDGAETATTVVWRADEDAVAALIPQLVPFPAGADPGDRVRVRVLDGTGDTARVLPAARLLVAGGGQIVLIGNADRFDHTETLVFHGPGLPPDDAVAMAEALGLGTVREADAQDEDVDVTVVLGSDYQP